MNEDINIVCMENARDFMLRCGSTLSQLPDLNHNVLQIAAVVSDENRYYNKPYWFCTAESSTGVLGAAIYAEPDGLVMSALPRRAVKPILRAFLSSMPTPTRIVGCPDCILEASKYLSESSRTDLACSRVLEVGRLDRVTPPRSDAPGRLRRGEAADLTVARAWGKLYELERPSFVNVTEYYEKKLSDGELYIWENTNPIVALTVSGRTGLGVRISSVFTAPDYRASGYASSAVATLCTQLLQANEFVVLTWRNGDLTGNLYKSIGFYPIGQQQCLINTDRKVNC